MTQSQFGPIIAEDVEFVLRKLSACLEVLGGTTLLVTGASGFLCSYFVDVVAAINDRGRHPACRVLAVDNLRTGSCMRLGHLEEHKDLRLIHHDVSQPFDPEERVDWIIHGASIASPTFYRRYPLETIDVNVSGTRHLLELARQNRVKGMLYLSTSEIYGDPDPAFIPTPEDYRGSVSCTGPRACYDESKRLAETLCVTYARLYNVPVKIVRPFNVYGPGQPLADGRIIPDLMKAALKRDPIVLFSDGRATRAFCYVTDAVQAMWHVLLSAEPGEIFNVGNDEHEISIADLAQEMRAVAGPPWLQIEKRTSRDEHYLTDNPQRRCPDLRKLRGTFDWQPHVSLHEGLSRALRSYAEQFAPRPIGTKA
jgi:dTDP-glucose 4,6-dehydratase/UDP-glucuronate decarboxylase